MVELQDALQNAHQDAMSRSQEMSQVQETNAVAQKDLASDMDRVYRGMQQFDAAMVCQIWIYLLVYTVRLTFYPFS